jgi:hypothetical protein
MNKEFILYEQALALKELGFDKPCLGGYIRFRGSETFELAFYKYRNVDFNTTSNIYVSAPLYQQAFRWFREKYGLEGTPQRAEDFMWYKWIIHLYNENGKKYVANWYEYKTYEEAELACLIKLIEITKQQQQ